MDIRLARPHQGMSQLLETKRLSFTHNTHTCTHTHARAHAHTHTQFLWRSLADASGMGKGTKVVAATLGLNPLASTSGACPFCSLPSLLLK